MKPETIFQSKLKEELEKVFPGCIIKRNSTDDIQGFPDITIYVGGRYAHLECKRSRDAPRRPNQEYYIRLFKAMGGYASFVYPENKETVIAELRLYFRK